MHRNSFIAVAVALTACLVGCSHAGHGFTVIKNVNRPGPPVEKVVIFAKGQSTEHLSLTGVNDDCKPAFNDDGAFEAHITGNGQVNPRLSWTAAGDLPESFDAGDYEYVLLTCKLAGTVKRTFDNGRVADTRGANLWFTFTLYDAAGERTAMVNLANVAEDGRTPAEMTTLRIPMILFTKGAYNNTVDICAVGFYWGSTHAYNNRDCRLVVERIALAN